MPVPIRHTSCGEIVMWYMGGRGDSVCSSSTIVYLDGTRPAVCSGVQECPHCGGGMYPGRNLIRCFDEDVAPGFDIQEAWRSGRRVNLRPGPPDPVMVAVLTHNRDMARWIFGAMAVGFLVMAIVAVAHAG